MKNLLIISLFSASMAASAINTSTVVVQSAPSQTDKQLAWVDEQIQAILPARIGVSESFINTLKDPMKMKKPVVATTGGSKLLPPPKLGGSGVLSVPKVVEEPLRLQAVLNQSALINKKWYKVNDSVRNYTLAEIKSHSVLLVGKKDQQLILFLSKPNTNIHITTK